MKSGLMSRSHLRRERRQSSESSMRKEWEQLENQNQALKLRLQQKEAEVTELLSYVEEMMKEKGALCVC